MEDHVHTIPPGPGATPENSPGRSGSAVPLQAVRWRPLLTVLAAVHRVISGILAAFCIITFVLLVAIVTWQVFTREVFNDSAPWTQEAAQYTFVVLALVAAAYVFSERGHIAVEVLIERLPLRLQKTMGVIIELIVVVFTVFVFIWGGWRVAVNAWGQAIATLPPLNIGHIYLVLPIAGVLIVFYSLAHLIGILAGAEKPTPEFHENAEVI